MKNLTRAEVNPMLVARSFGRTGSKLGSDVDRGTVAWLGVDIIGIVDAMWLLT